jgi:hypothetical protein
MSKHPFVLIDQTRASQFHFLGTARRLFHGAELQVDANGVAWLVARRGDAACGVTWLGPGAVFDPHAPPSVVPDLPGRRQAMWDADEVRHRHELRRVVGRLRLGRHCERLLWAIHRHVLTERTSVLAAPDCQLAAAVWGPGQRPRQWRQDLSALLDSLTWLHLAQAIYGASPTFGLETTVLLHAADLRGSEQDVCAGHCPGRRGGRHHHYQINVGPGFLGLLEQFGAADGSGARSYSFPIGGRRGPGPSLRKAGRTGELVQVYVPAKLGEPGACDGLTGDQHRVLQALVRETTLGPRRKGRLTSEVEILSGNTIPSASGQGQILCPALGETEQYVGFNGNGVRRGLGYYLTTEGGWLAKAGYAREDVESFLADLGVLATRLGLIAIGIDRHSDRVYPLNELRGMAIGGRGLNRVLVRVYTRADYLRRWNAAFGWDEAGEEGNCDGHAQVAALKGAMAGKGIKASALADGIHIDRSFLSKVLLGRKLGPQQFIARALEWVASQQTVPSPSRLLWPPNQWEEGQSLLQVALAYREYGWSVVPQRPGQKQPAVRWKRFQSELPTVAMLEGWFRTWPDAGLAVVLGPVSSLFVADVDGPEAHASLLERLGEEPRAPKALSGSRKPHRYHLFFRCPAVATKAKATPWNEHLEFRGQGGIVVIPPSLHKSGHRYEWAPGRSPADVSLPELPAEIQAALEVRPRVVAHPSSSVEVPSDLKVSPSSRRFLRGEYANGPRWNEWLFRAACDLQGRGIALEVAEPLLLKGAQPWDSTEEAAAQATILSAYSQEREPGRC